MRMLGMNGISIATITDALLAALTRFSFYWPVSWRGISALILGIFLAHWFWILFAPHATFTAAIAERSAGIEAGRIFGVAASTDASTQGVALPNVQLLGVFAASGGKKGFAVLKLDDTRQMGVAEGEEITPGTRLVTVQADHVLLERAGIKQRVNLDNMSPGSANQGIQPAYVAGREKNKSSNENIIPEHILSQIQSAQQQNQADIKAPGAQHRMIKIQPSEAGEQQ